MSFKFDSDLGEALYKLTLDGLHDETTGDVNDYGWAIDLVIVSVRDVENYPELIKGNYLLYTDEQGFVTWEGYLTEEDARAKFEAIDRDYGLFLRGYDSDRNENWDCVTIP